MLFNSHRITVSILLEILFYKLCLRQGLTVKLWLPWSSLYRWGWPDASSAGITSMHTTAPVQEMLLGWAWWCRPVIVPSWALRQDWRPSRANLLSKWKSKTRMGAVTKTGLQLWQGSCLFSVSPFLVLYVPSKSSWVTVFCLKVVVPPMFSWWVNVFVPVQCIGVQQTCGIVSCSRFTETLHSLALLQ